MSQEQVELQVQIRNKYMIKKYGKLKTAVLLEIYQKQLHSLLAEKMDEIDKIDENNNFDKKIQCIKVLYNYFYYTRDIWCGNIKKYSEFRLVLKNKLVEFSKSSKECSSIFLNFLEKFGYICNYIKRDNNKCHIKCDDFLCKKHVNCYKRLKNKVCNYNVLPLPVVLSNIILKYLIPKNY